MSQWLIQKTSRPNFSLENTKNNPRGGRGDAGKGGASTRRRGRGRGVDEEEEWDDSMEWDEEEEETEEEEDVRGKRKGGGQQGKKRQQYWRRELDKALAPARRGRAVAVLTTYEQLRLQREAMVEVTWMYAVLDEGHRIRNPDVDTTLACKQVSCWMGRGTGRISSVYRVGYAELAVVHRPVHFMATSVHV